MEVSNRRFKITVVEGVTDSPVVHVEVYKWSVRTYDAMVEAICYMEEYMLSLGYTSVLTADTTSKHWEKFLFMFGFEYLASKDGKSAYIYRFGE